MYFRKYQKRNTLEECSDTDLDEPMSAHPSPPPVRCPPLQRQNAMSLPLHADGTGDRETLPSLILGKITLDLTTFQV